MKNKLLLTLSILAVMHASHAAEVEAGGLTGKFSVSPSGGAVYDIPLALPAGINGVQPSLSVTYNSQGGYGLLGQGASLSGLSVLQRCGQVKIIDGTNRPIAGDANDRLCLDGQQLLLVSGDSYWADNAIYSTEIKNFARVQAVVDQGNKYYQVIAKDGQVSRYGSRDDSRERAGDSSFDPNLIIAWYIDTAYKREYPGVGITYAYRIVNPSDFGINDGNMISKKMLDAIRYVYGSNDATVKAVMNYMPVNLYSKQYAPGGLHLQNNYLLKGISVCESSGNAPCGETSSGAEQGKLISKYKFGYQDTNQDNAMARLPKLTSVTACGINDQCLKPVTFNYNAVNLQVDKRVVQLSGVADADRVIHGDFNGDGLADLVITPVLPDRQISALTDFPQTAPLNLFFSDGYNFNKTIKQRSTYPNVYNCRSELVNGTYYIHYGVNDPKAFPCNAYENLSNFIPIPNAKTSLGYAALSTAPYSSQNSIITLMFSAASFVLNSDVNGSFNPDEVRTPTTGYGIFFDTLSNFQAAQINDDGIPDLVQFLGNSFVYVLGGSTASDYITNMGYAPSSIQLGSNFSLPQEEHFFADVNGDGISDVIVLNSFLSNIKTAFLKNIGYDHEVVYDYSSVAPPPNINNGDFTLTGDFNGDGLLDIASYYASSRQLLVHFSKGNGYFESIKFNITNPNTKLSSLYTWVADWNGDGRADIVNWDKDAQVFHVFLGSRGAEGKIFVPYDQGGIDYVASSYDRVFPDDYNGDGRTDVLGLNGSQATIWSNNGTNGELNQIDTFSGTIKVQFSRLTDKSIYIKDTNAAVPQQNDIQDARQVVKSVQTSNGIGGYSEPMLYFYGGLKVDRDRGSLGFRWITSTVVNDAARDETGGGQRWSKELYTEYSQQFPFVGLVANSKTFTCNHTTATATCYDLTTTQNNWQYKPFTLNSAVGARTSYFPYVNDSHTQTYRLDQMYQGGAVAMVGKTESAPSAHPEIVPISNAVLSLPAILSVLLDE
ncbi:FG-GAP-like repeat-containing protein [Aquirhabdus parva]|uniref:FG-GAP-like repeat-containing protein n=1 Tax=Aquirhabdus parva TaxID=2283318 RepID=UPI0013B44BD4|nr:FG-GAP-like repeat-containing protein [Aquirhabdus parva]